MNSDSKQSTYDKAASLYRSGDFHAASQLYHPLASDGSTSCQRLVGWMYLLGEGVDKNFDKALFWLTKAAEAGDPEAQFGVGRVYLHREEFESAHSCCERAAKQDFAPAFYRLGRMHQTGKAVPQDTQRAYNDFSFATSKGHIRSMRWKAVLLLRGQKGLFGRVTGVFVFLRFVGTTLKLALTDQNSPRFLS